MISKGPNGRESALTVSDDDLLIAIVHADRPPWSQIARDGQGSTWLSPTTTQASPVVYVHGSSRRQLWGDLDRWHERVRWARVVRGFPSRVLRSADFVATFPIRTWIPPHQLDPSSHLPAPCLEVAVPDAYVLAPSKELALFSYFLRKTDARWLYMTTTSSYVRAARLLERARDLGPHGVYAGTRVEAGRHAFASGANRLLSRDVVEAIMGSRKYWDRSVLEDLGMGKLVHRLGVQLITLPTLNLQSVDDVGLLPAQLLEENHHFRVKSGPLDERDDVSVMRALHERILIEGL